MNNGAYYVYALKDPRNSPAIPFYIGKGVGNRAWEHDLKPEESIKGRRIADIKGVGQEVLVTILCSDLSELQALKIEAELISAFGTEATGGLLTNSVLPTGALKKQRRRVVIPMGAPEKAQLGLALLKESVLELARANDDGVTNAEVSHSLGLHSTYGGGSKDYLSWSLLGILMKDGLLKRNDEKVRGRHEAQIR